MILVVFWDGGYQRRGRGTSEGGQGRDVLTQSFFFCCEVGTGF